MDEEELEQSNKININSFFGSIQSIDRVAKSAQNSSETSLKAARSNLDLIKALQSSFASLRDEVEQITRYILIEQDERSEILNKREQEAARREDDIQKGIFDAEDAREKALEDEKPFTQENRFLRGIKGSISNIVTNNADLLVGAGAATILGAIPFNFGGLVPGRGNADTVNAKLTPGEFVISKDTVDSFGSNFFENLNDSKPETSSYSSSIQYSTRANPETGEIEVDPNSLEYPFMLEGATQQFYQDKVEQLQSDISDAKLEAKVGGYKPDISHLEEELNMYKGKYDDTLEYGSRYNVGGNKNQNVKSDDEENKGLFGGLFGGDKKNENVRSDDKGKGLFGGLFGGDQIRKGEAAVKGEGKPEGFMRGLAGVGDFMTSGIFDLDKRGDSKLDTARKGAIDFVTGGIFDLDKRGDSKLDTARKGAMDFVTGGMFDFDKKGDSKLQRVQKGMMDFVTGGVFDFDKKGDSKLDTARKGVMDFVTGGMFDFDRRGDGKEKNTSDVSDRLIRKDFKNDEDFEFYKNNFDDFDDKQLQNKRNQLSMETTVSPDGSITSKGSGTFIAGEIVRPGESLSPKQRAAITMGIQMGNTYSSEIMENYNNSGGSPSKEEFDNYEKEKSKDIRPEEEKSKNITPERTLGEKVLNRFSFLPGINKSEKTEKMKIAGEMQDVEIGDDGFPTEDAIEKMMQGMGKKSDKKPQGLMRGIAGIADHMTGGLTDFDKRGKGILNPFSPISSDKNLKSDKSMRETPQNVMEPLEGGDETIVLPPTVSQSPTPPPPSSSPPPAFAKSNNKTTLIGDTDSPIVYIDVISNQYLSIP